MDDKRGCKTWVTVFAYFLIPAWLANPGGAISPTQDGFSGTWAGL